MSRYSRYAIYYAPEPGPLADFGAAWLGWDPAAGVEARQPAVAGLPRPLAEITATPRKYGFHGTLKPPFRLVEGATEAGLAAAAAALAARLAPVPLPDLALCRLGDFLALVPGGGEDGGSAGGGSEGGGSEGGGSEGGDPAGEPALLAALAAEVVEALDPFRAALTREDLIRREAARLSTRQRALLDRWGYPYVMDEFRFHLTLTGALGPAEAAAVEAALAPLVTPVLPRPFAIREICLFAEAADGRFRILHRYPLGAGPESAASAPAG